MPATTTYRNPVLLDLGDRPWIGDRFDEQPHRILLLGESYNTPAPGGGYSYVTRPELEHDAVYMRELILSNIYYDAFFENPPTLLGRTRDEFWHTVAFTNLVIGQLPTGARPTAADFQEGTERLAILLKTRRIDGVLSLGKSQAPYAARVCKALGIAFAEVVHPSGRNNRMGPGSSCTPERMKQAWDELHRQLAARRKDASLGAAAPAPTTSVRAASNGADGGQPQTQAARAEAMLEVLVGQIRPDRTIPPQRLADVLKRLDLNPSHYAVAAGQCRSLLDWAATEVKLPLIGRLMLKDKPDEETGAWTPWEAHMPDLVEAARRHRWSEADLEQLRRALRSGKVNSADAAWKQLEPRSTELLVEALATALGSALESSR